MGLKTAIAGIWLVVAMPAQVVTSFQLQKRVAHNVYRWSALSCSNTATTFDTGWIYQSAVGLGIPVIQPLELNSAVTTKGPLKITLSVLQFASMFAAYLVTSGTVSASTKVASYLLAGSGAVAETQTLLTQINDSSAGLLQGQLSIPVNGCIQNYLYARKLTKGTQKSFTQNIVLRVGN